MNLASGFDQRDRRVRPGLSMQQAKANNARDDQIDRHDEIQQPRRDQDEDAREKRHDGLKMSYAECHFMHFRMMR